MNFLISLKYNIFKFSPYLVALGMALMWMDAQSEFHALGTRVVEYHLLAHAIASVLLVLLMIGAVKSTAEHLEASRQDDYSEAWEARTPPGNLFNWQLFLHQAAYAQLFLMGISAIIALVCVGMKLFNYSVYTDNNFFNFLMLLESYFTILAFCFYCQTERIASVLQKFRAPAS